ncbi:MAG: hypothetical protein ACJAYU_002642 [Bradymonadia bacterium]|jgi:hypothetical protein
MKMNRTLFYFSLLASPFFIACTDDVPPETDLGGTDVGDAGADTSTDVTDAADVGTDLIDDTTPADTGDDADVAPQECEPLLSDYSPGADDEWPECVSDDGTYHQVEESISTIGRVAGFETIGDLLWRDGTPSPEDFVEARDAYATGEGLDSRVQRREDEHYPSVVDAGSGETLRCRDEGVPAMDPERCVGPALILPILNDAFVAGIEGTDPEIQAARIEAALLWFFYVSTHKEATTCATAAKDCDSSYAYYSGGVDRSGGLGLAGVVRSVDSEAHDRVWDAILAVRCWRDLDDGEEASDLDTRDRAVAQLDRALLHGVAAIVSDRFGQWEADQNPADLEFVRILGPVLDRAALEIGADLAAAARDAIEDGSGDLAGALSATFPCP